jgi:hypothetical protein
MVGHQSFLDDGRFLPFCEADCRQDYHYLRAGALDEALVAGRLEGDDVVWSIEENEPDRSQR